MLLSDSKSFERPFGGKEILKYLVVYKEKIKQTSPLNFRLYKDIYAPNMLPWQRKSTITYSESNFHSKA